MKRSVKVGGREMLKYQYVVIQGDTDYYEMLIHDTLQRGDAVAATGIFDVKSRALKDRLYKIYRMNRSKKRYKLNSLLKPFMFHRRIDDNKPVCFLIWGQYANEVNAFWGRDLRRRYPGCKLVCRFEDVIEKMPYRNINDYKDSFDLLQTFDELEARKYGIDYFPSWYDKTDGIEEGIESDVLFIGRGKDRIEEIVELYKRLTEAGLNCKFYLVDVPENKRVKIGNLEYGGYLPYRKVLEYVKGTKCMVEILQQDAESETLRVFEAIAYNKKLITNNHFISKKTYYSPEKIQIYEKVEDIDITFIQDKKQIKYEEGLLSQYLPIKLFEYTDTVLSKKDEKIKDGGASKW